MSRWNIEAISFYGLEGRRRMINFELDKVNVISGASGTGKSAIIDAIDYCLGSSKCSLPYFVRGRAEAVAVHWVRGDDHLIVGRNIPLAGRGTEQMFVKFGKNLALPVEAAKLEGPTNRETARAMIEMAFGIDDNDSADVASKTEKGRATIRDVTPYMFLSGDVIISRITLLHDMNRPEKARDIKATIPYFLGAVDQESILAGRRLRQLEATLERHQRRANAEARSQSLLTERSMMLLTQASSVGLIAGPQPTTASDQALLELLTNVSKLELRDPPAPDDDQRIELEDERRLLVSELRLLREQRGMISRTVKEASGYETAVSGQSHRLKLVEHLKLDEGRCPVCDADNATGRAIADQIRHSLLIVSREVASSDVTGPRLADHAASIEQKIIEKSSRLREVEAQLSGLIRQLEDSAFSGSLLQDRARVIGRIDQFLETTAKDYAVSPNNASALEAEILRLRDKVDPQAKRDRLRDAENLVSNFATRMLSSLPAEVPVTGARILFSSTPAISLIEPVKRAALALQEVGSDQNYLAIHLALAFALQQLFETIDAPVPGVLVVDQISRPYYPTGGDEKRLADMEKDEDKAAMQKIVRFLFEETTRRIGLQVILLEHAYIEEDAEYVAAVRGRWTKSTGEKLIPSDWPERS